MLADLTGKSKPAEIVQGRHAHAATANGDGDGLSSPGQLTPREVGEEKRVAAAAASLRDGKREAGEKV
jgi:hypothetical protein